MNDLIALKNHESLSIDYDLTLNKRREAFVHFAIGLGDSSTNLEITEMLFWYNKKRI
jgi:hypothetical protein